MNLPYWTDALGWTLLHSLWQGGLLALLYLAGRYALRHHGPQSRYLLALGTLVTLLGWAGYTLLSLWPDAPLAVSTGDIAWESASDIVAAEATFSWKDWLQPALPWLSLAWLAGAALLALRWLGGMGYTQSLRYRGTRPAPPAWQAQLATWQQRLGLRRPVTLLLSHRISSPLTLGFFKPVILIPVSLLSGLTPAQWEAILLHELAHIRRADYLINLIQSLVEILFFYHPLVWGLSRDLSREREACCDDLAVSACGDALRYAEALTRLQRIRFTVKPLFAMHFNSDKQGFTARIQRLFAPAAQPRRPRLAGLLALVLIASLAIAPQFATNAAVPNDPTLQAAPATAEPVVIEIDRSWTRAQLEELQASLAAEGVKLQFSQIETDAEGHLHTLAGSIELPSGGSGSFAANGLGTLRLVYDATGLLQVDVKGEEEVNPEDGQSFEIDVEAGDEEAAAAAAFFQQQYFTDSPEVKVIRFSGQRLSGDSSRSHRFFFISPDSAADTEVDVEGKRLQGKGNMIFISPDSDGEVILNGETATEIRIKGLRSDSVQRLEVIRPGLGENKHGGVFIISPDHPTATEPSGSFWIQKRDGSDLDPIYYLDGKRIDLEELREISPSKIGHVEVLKGEKATDAYGIEAEGGVIRIYTKDEARLKRSELGEKEGAVILRPDAETKTQVRVTGLRKDNALIFIDGKRVSRDEMKALDPDEIDRIEVVKSDGDGVEPGIYIFTKSAGQAKPLDQNLQVKAFPNPASELVQVEVKLETEQPLRVEVYDLQGRLIETLTDKETSAGSHLYTWKVKNAPAGTYLIRTFAGEQSRTDKVVIE